MKTDYINKILNIVTVITVTMFFSCKDNFKEVQKIGVSENTPIGIAENINLKYTDSGKLKAILISPKMLDYQNRDFPYAEFPEGIVLDLFDKENKKSVVSANYAISYSSTNLIDLQGNVVITTATNDTLYAQQLYYDQKKDWLFTNLPITLKANDGSTLKGNVFDTDRDLKDLELIEFHDSDFVVNN
ncbi:LPS export ABC transporter periplasmic protein LptC [Oceanihabitans sp. IOP_32]|uniref:LPS export ABC transporter periplasmic protein LptC n=1 Tax=Oceanihabitans sp. IOP_32 TaxID=2529032 RepID=UPI0012933DA1|nr:LPS export ABC transporter periplasmic protein LptC [Oceanihabitans sp. IOP_32]QFZ53976.1 LPS export ABC transporter periplasmic protein LptC [Oceanihabitans sp. IOP_32]